MDNEGEWTDEPWELSREATKRPPSDFALRPLLEVKSLPEALGTKLGWDWLLILLPINFLLSVS